jgi:hypothetical protein
MKKMSAKQVVKLTKILDHKDLIQLDEEKLQYISYRKLLDKAYSEI